MQKYIWWVGGALVLIAAVVLFFSWRANRHTPAPTVAKTPAQEAPAPAIQNPVPDQPPAPQPLPPLQSSDAPLHDAMSDVMGKRAVDSIFKPEQVVRHIVVTVDNLSRKRAAFES